MRLTCRHRSPAEVGSGGRLILIACFTLTWAMAPHGSFRSADRKTPRGPEAEFPVAPNTGTKQETGTQISAVQLRLDPDRLFPAAGAEGICPDTPLRITFPFPPALGAAGKLGVFDASDNRLVESIDIRARTATKTIGGLDNFTYYPVIISGNEASIHLQNSALGYNRTYFVMLDCRLGDAVNPVAWQVQDAPGIPASVHFWEFHSHLADGTPVDASLRHAGSRQLKQPEDAGIIASYSNPTFVLGNGWNPKLSPIFVAARAAIPWKGD